MSEGLILPDSNLILPGHFDGNAVRILGHIPPTEQREMKFASAPLREMDPSQWVEFEYPVTPVKIKDQDGKGACNGHAAATSLEWARWLAGMEHHDLSAWFVYAILCRGIDRGSNIGDALDLLQSQGTCLDASLAYATINPSRIDASDKTEAARFKIDKGTRLKNFTDMMNATQQGRPGNYSIRVGGNFNRLDSEGLPGFSGGPGNHAVTFGLGAKKMANGKWKIKWQNSWNTSWGQGGYAWVDASRIDNQPYFEAYCIGAPMSDPNDATNPPIAA